MFFAPRIICTTSHRGNRCIPGEHTKKVLLLEIASSEALASGSVLIHDLLGVLIVSAQSQQDGLLYDTAFQWWVPSQ